MKMHYIVPIFIVILLGILCADFVYKDYLNKEKQLESNVYFLQQGVYIDTSSIKNISLNYITVEESHKYYTYVGMTCDRKIAEKLKKLYEKKGIQIYIKSQDIDNEEFLSELSQYDVLLKNTDDEEVINNILETILSTYEELVKYE